MSPESYEPYEPESSSGEGASAPVRPAPSYDVYEPGRSPAAAPAPHPYRIDPTPRRATGSASGAIVAVVAGVVLGIVAIAYVSDSEPEPVAPVITYDLDDLDDCVAGDAWCGDLTDPYGFGEDAFP